MQVCSDLDSSADDMRNRGLHGLPNFCPAEQMEIDEDDEQVQGPLVNGNDDDSHGGGGDDEFTGIRAPATATFPAVHELRARLEEQRAQIEKLLGVIEKQEAAVEHYVSQQQLQQ